MGDLVGFEIDDVDFVLGDVEDDHLIILHHSEKINDIVVIFFKENLSVGIEVNDALLLAGLIHSDHHKSIAVGCRGPEYFRHWWLEFDSYLFCDRLHLMKINISLMSISTILKYNNVLINVKELNSF